VVATPSPQPLAAAASPALVDDSLEFIPPELKMAMKNSQDGEARNALPVTAKTSLNMASIASAASSLQQVPLTTASAAMHNQGPGLPVVDNFMAPTPTLSSTLNTPVQNPAWSQGVTERVAWMVQGNVQSVELKLNPANLGPLEIKLTMHDDNRATIHFVTSHAAVRDALDAAMPRLRDMLESQGLEMADVNVSDSGVQGNQAQAGEDQPGGASTAAASTGESDGPGETLVQESIMRVDVSDGVSIYA
jgi:flagellar hook-length control protein FliK